MNASISLSEISLKIIIFLGFRHAPIYTLKHAKP